ncbi:MAG: TlpA disulfide reductase family protein [Bacteroidales bacterium]|nr:TlpA disulfide reductase family protein [Bacteroidales bacterium]
MKFILFSFILFLSISGYSQTPEVIDFDPLEKRWSNSNDTLYVINYWATWCIPCIEELPDFIKLDQEMKEEKFKMILVSLDFPSHADSRVLPFIRKHNITTEVVILDDDANVWIDRVNKSWDGAIPATQFIRNQNKEFYKEQLSHERLLQIVNKYFEPKNK